MKHLFKLSVCLILLLCLAACLGVSASAEGTVVSISSALRGPITGSSSADRYYTVDSGSYILKTDVLLSGYLKIESGKEVTIDLNGRDLKFAGRYNFGTNAADQSKFYSNIYLFNGAATKLLAKYPIGKFADWNPEAICVDKKNGCIWIGEDCGDEKFSILHKVEFSNL